MKFLTDGEVRLPVSKRQAEYRVAVTQEPKVIAAILDCLSRKEQPP